MLLVFVCLIALYLVRRRAETKSLAEALRYAEGSAITASRETGFYGEPIRVSLRLNMEVPDGARIRYTLNGDDPSGKSEAYLQEIEIGGSEDGPSVVPLKARIFYQDEVSPTYSWTYVITRDEEQKFSIPVISITSPYRGLYSYEQGILADGLTKSMANVTGNSGTLSGNYFQKGDQWIRGGRVTMFSPEGGVLLDQNIGLSVSGGFSRTWEKKSFKIKAGAPYDMENDKFRLDIFQDTDSDELSYVNEFTNLKLRCSEHWSRAFSGELGKILAAESGFDGYQYSKPAILFLNGQYYSLVDLMPSFSDSYISRRFSVGQSEFIEKFKKSEAGVLEKTGVLPLFQSDLTDEKNRELLEERVDMDNYLLYYAIEVLFNNTDWPRNNYEAWRSSVKEPGNAASDGRLRFLLYDLDFMYSRDRVSEKERGTDTFRNLMDREFYGGSSEFSNVMRSKEYRDRFVTIVTDLLNSSFDASHVRTLMEQIYIGKRRELLRWRGGEFDEEMLRSIQASEKLADIRADEMEEDFREYFGLEDKYDLVLSVGDGAAVSWNQMEVRGGGSYRCRYYSDPVIRMSAKAAPGYRFVCWNVNGEKVNSPELDIDGSSAPGGRCVIKAVTRQVKGPLLLIQEISAKSDSDWIRLSNVGSAAVDLSEYCLSDREYDPQMYTLPDKKLGPGESVLINGRKNYYAVGEYICNFNLRDGETLFLTGPDGRIADSLVVPRMSRYETYGRINLTNRFVYFNNLDEKRRQADPFNQEE